MNPVTHINVFTLMLAGTPTTAQSGEGKKKHTTTALVRVSTNLTDLNFSYLFIANQKHMNPLA